MDDGRHIGVTTTERPGGGRLRTAEQNIICCPCRWWIMENRLVGIVTIDDAVEVMEQEATEDFEKMAAMAPS